MRIARLLSTLATGLGVLTLITTLISCNMAGPRPRIAPAAQVPTWSNADMQFYLHGSMSTEVVPEALLHAFVSAYPDIFPTRDLAHLGAIPDPQFGWPLGFSRAKVDHLAGLSSVGINCAVCHTSEISVPGQPPVRVLGNAAIFDAEAFFGSIVLATFRSQDPANMKNVIWAFDQASWPEVADARGRQVRFDARWQEQLPLITAAMAADPAAARGFPSKTTDEGDASTGLHVITPSDLNTRTLDANADFPALAVNFLRLFHNMRAALHVPDQLPEKLPPSSGPSRNDAFGLLSAGLFNTPQPYAPVKYGTVWNMEKRGWVHWDGNTPSPIARNILAVLGLGAPLIGDQGKFDFKLVQRHTDITEKIVPPRYPWSIDRAAAARGKAHFESSCVQCHDGTYGDDRLYSPDIVKTDPLRAQLFTAAQAEGFNKFLGGLKSPGYAPPAAGLRSTGKYYAPSLAAVWARSPYLHNGSIRTMEQLLSPAAARQITFKRGTRIFDPETMGYIDEGHFLLDTKTPGNSNSGHEYGTTLTPAQKTELLEYLKTL